ncbi:flagellar protein FlbA, partial [Pseudomonas sp. HMWF010]
MSRKRALEGSASSLAQADVGAAAIVQRGIAATPIGDSASTEALARLERIANEIKNQDNARVLAQAIVAIKTRDYPRAEELALKILQDDERSGLAWHILAIAKEKVGEFATSMQAYEAALQLLADHGPVAGDLGRLAFRMN